MADVVDYRTLLPDKIKCFVGCFVEITLREAGKLEGWVYTIDPVSHAVVIAKESKGDDPEHCGDSRTVVIIMAKAIEQLRVVETTKSEPEWLNNFATKKKHEYTSDELRKRKTCVIEWLSKNRVPIMENAEDNEENVHVIGGLVIEPPYDTDSCQGTNEIVLERIQKLIRTMP